MPVNFPAWKIFLAYHRGLIDRQFTGRYVHWGINLAGIDFILRLHGIPEEEQPQLAAKIMACCAAVIEEERSDHERKA